MKLDICWRYIKGYVIDPIRCSDHISNIKPNIGAAEKEVIVMKYVKQMAKECGSNIR